MEFSKFQEKFNKATGSPTSAWGAVKENCLIFSVGDAFEKGVDNYSLYTNIKLNDNYMVQYQSKSFKKLYRFLELSSGLICTQSGEPLVLQVGHGFVKPKYIFEDISKRKSRAAIVNTAFNEFSAASASFGTTVGPLGLIGYAASIPPRIAYMKIRKRQKYFKFWVRIIKFSKLLEFERGDILGEWLCEKGRIPLGDAAKLAEQCFPHGVAGELEAEADDYISNR